MNTQNKEAKELKQEDLRKQISELVDAYAAIEYERILFEPGKMEIPPSGKLIGAEELKNMVDAALDGWLTTGRFNKQFEEKLANIGKAHV